MKQEMEIVTAKIKSQKIVEIEEKAKVWKENNSEFVMEYDADADVEFIDYKFEPKSSKSIILKDGTFLRCTRLCEHLNLKYFCKTKGFNKDTGEEIFGQPYNVKIAEGIAKQYHIMTVEGTIYIYRDGCYKIESARDIVTYESNNVLGIYSTKNNLKEIEKHLKDITKKPMQLVDGDITCMNVKNGIYNFESGELLPHSPDYLSTTQFDIEYNPDARCPVFESYMADVLEDKYHKTILQAASLMLIPYNKAQHIMFLAGIAGNGKSVWYSSIIE